MIVKVWGEVNNEHIDFQKVPDRQNYWEGYAHRVRSAQDVQIWAENDIGARGYLHCQIILEFITETCTRILISPYRVTLLNKTGFSYQANLLDGRDCLCGNACP